MTNVRRPIHLQLIMQRTSFASQQQQQLQTPSSPSQAPKPLSPTGDSLPSEILPHLFVGNLEQTNRETLNRLNISYILSLGLLPLISDNQSPTSPTTKPAQVVTSAQYINNQQQLQQQQMNPSSPVATQTVKSLSGSPTTTVTSTSTSQHPKNNKTQTNQQQQPQSPHILLPLHNSSKDFKIKIRASQNQSCSLSAAPASANSSGRDDENKGLKIIRSVHCKCINIQDRSNQDLEKFFDEANLFINEALSKKCNVLIHCLAGISRSPTIAIAYLMRSNSLKLQDAYNLVKQRRPQIDPNLGFMGQLMCYEKSLANHDNYYTTSNNNNNNSNTNNMDQNHHHHHHHHHIHRNNNHHHQRNILNLSPQTATTKATSLDQTQTPNNNQINSPN